jgi:dihydrofolate reductase
MTLSLIVAATKEGYIGNDNTLSWFLPSDLKWFKELTINNTVVMGRKTYESIGKPLPNRINHVISKTLDQKDGIEIFNSVEDWLKKNQNFLKSKTEKAFVIGGVEIYNQFLSSVTEVYFSELEESEEQKKYSKYDKSISFSPQSLLNSGWKLLERYQIIDKKGFFKACPDKFIIKYDRNILIKYEE